MEDTRTNMTPDTSTAGPIGSTIKNGIVSNLQGLNDIETAMVSLVRNTVSLNVAPTEP